MFINLYLLLYISILCIFVHTRRPELMHHPPNSNVEALIPNVMVLIFTDGTFGR